MRTIKAIEQDIILCETVEDIEALNLDQDTRKGVLKLVDRQHKVIVKKALLREKFEAMQSYERQTGVLQVAGIDEAGRGPIAGDVVAAAVILNPGFELLGLNDSKQLSEVKRFEYREYIMENSVYGIGKCSAAEIDSFNIYEATKIAMQRAVFALSVTPEHLLIDAMEIESDVRQTKIIKGDANSISIAAASVLAKTERDLDMLKMHELYPMYGFDQHKGYGTKDHIAALEMYGASPIHRKTFEPVASIIN
ncbi:ribonuclease HII [Aliicoccus persicus]|uniref:Ribonuclease HII n=1 Tax=Aliicoccus persicus TaxID=930138 RepID=A0A662Z0W9_9STAP|nr:ribonuclease HII [Aliicoccus persicus]SEV81600.1 RNase HII [Aliicoccus persicus]